MWSKDTPFKNEKWNQNITSSENLCVLIFTLCWNWTYNYVSFSGSFRQGLQLFLIVPENTIVAENPRIRIITTRRGVKVSISCGQSDTPYAWNWKKIRIYYMCTWSRCFVNCSWMTLVFSRNKNENPVPNLRNSSSPDCCTFTSK